MDHGSLHVGHHQKKETKDPHHPPPPEPAHLQAFPCSVGDAPCRNPPLHVPERILWSFLFIICLAVVLQGLSKVSFPLCRVLYALIVRRLSPEQLAGCKRASRSQTMWVAESGGKGLEACLNVNLLRGYLQLGLQVHMTQARRWVPDLVQPTLEWRALGLLSRASSPTIYLIISPGFFPGLTRYSGHATREQECY